MGEQKFTHRVNYPDNHGITLVDIAETLLAHDRIIKLVPFVLEQSVDGLVIKNISIELSYAEEGSLLEQFVVTVFSVFQDNFSEKIVGVVEAMTGTDIPKEYEPIIALIILLLFFYGARWLYNKVHKTSDGALNINGSYNNILQISAERLSIEPSKLESILAEATKGPNKKATAKAAQRFFKPAQRNGTGRIEVNGYGEISRETVAEIPTDVDIEASDDDREMLHMPGARVQLRAHDLDRKEQGWYGVVEDETFNDKRLPITFYPTVDPRPLFGARSISADITLEQKPDDKGEWTPKRIHIMAVNETFE
jgi:hypothetical protein